MNLASRISQYRDSPLFRRLFSNAAWSVGGTGFARFIVIALNIPVARILGIDNYGQLIIIQSTIAMAGVFAGLGMGLAAIKYTAELKERDPVRLGNILSMFRRVSLIGGALISAVLIITSSYIATYVINLPSLAILIAISAISVIFLTLDAYQSSTLLGFGEVKKSAIAIFVPALLSVPATIVLVSCYGLVGAVIGLLLLSIFQFTFSYGMLSRVLKKNQIKLGGRRVVDWKLLRDFALPALLSGAMVTPVHWLCHVLLINSTGGQSQMAVLGIANQWFQILYFIPLIVGRITLPAITDAVIQGNHLLSKNILKGAIIANAVVVLPAAFLIIIFSESVMGLYGVTQTNAWLVLTLMVAAASIVSICAPAGLVFVAKGELWFSWLLNLIWAITYIAVSYYLLGFGAAGIAAGLLVAYIFHAIWSLLRVMTSYPA